jgi:hypothetical protein
MDLEAAVADLSELKKLAEGAVARLPGEEWFTQRDCESMLLAHPDDARHIAAASPEVLLRLIAVAEAAQRYYERYAQDEADDGDYAVPGMPGHNTGCSYEQAVDAAALRSALQELEK